LFPWGKEALVAGKLGEEACSYIPDDWDLEGTVEGGENPVIDNVTEKQLVHVSDHPEASEAANHHLGYDIATIRPFLHRKTFWSKYTTMGIKTALKMPTQTLSCACS